MKHEFEATTVECPNCHKAMISLKDTGRLVFACLDTRTCGWIAGPDVAVATYFRMKEMTER